VLAAVSFALGDNVENLTLTGAGNINVTGNGQNNALVGNSGNNLLDGGVGDDSMSGGLGDDTYRVDAVGDLVTEAAGEGNDRVESAVSYVLGSETEHLLLSGSGNINGTGNGGDNAVGGNAGNNVLNGGAGNDTLTGGLGNDTYYVDAAGDQVVEVSGGGSDLVLSTVSVSLAGTVVENLTLTGSDNLTGTGNGSGNVLTGNTGNNSLDGQAGNDTMAGGLGNDTYYVNATGDNVVETSGEGTDTILASVNYSLSGRIVEVLALTGTANLTATGNSLGNSLVGNDGNNLLDGQGGNDTLTGGLGNDTYIVNVAADVVVETAAAGNDLVQASATYTLSNDVERLELTGIASIDGTGNGLNNSLTGNSGNNSLDGAGGADTMIGGLGNDTYYIDNASDKITELASEGTDLAVASVSYLMAGTVLENLNLTGSSDIDATGNGVGNKLTGNSGNNRLDGQGGNDTLAGGFGNDTYIVQNTGDKVVEDSGQGTDTIKASVTYSLTGRYAETLELTGSANIDASGNSLVNTLIGNDGNNVLNGLGGNDTLTGGEGADIFLFQTGSRADRVDDFSAAQGD
ncbi:calcium-binding protein, partial [Asticcacaulis sp. AC402]|uniref:beta strand repeat-containing protein n=1 Tax=Asticcacaulis sp. AC402 TaxID=1282361 RepID=UPI0003C3C7E7